MQNLASMKGVILAGGTGSRLYPLTEIYSKQLQAVYDKPMIYYPLTTLIAAGISEICIISTEHDLGGFERLLKSGNQWGINLTYIIQPEPKGVADALILSEHFTGDSNFVLILGDNIFSGGADIPNAIENFEDGATIFAYHVPDPKHYGVVEFGANLKVISLEEKPDNPKSNYAIPGIYIFDKKASTIAKSIKPSDRGELEITDVNLAYLKRKKLQVHRLSRGFAWLDSGNSESLHDASSYIATIEKRQGIKIGCPEEAALVRRFITPEELRPSIDSMPNCAYKRYIEKVASEYYEN